MTLESTVEYYLVVGRWCVLLYKEKGGGCCCRNVRPRRFENVDGRSWEKQKVFADVSVCNDEMRSRPGSWFSVSMNSREGQGERNWSWFRCNDLDRFLLTCSGSGHLQVLEEPSISLAGRDWARTHAPPGWPSESWVGGGMPIDMMPRHACRPTHGDDGAHQGDP